MRRLSVSLLVVVLLSTIGLGWALDQLFAGLAKSENDSLQVYREIGSDLVSSAQSPEKLSTIVESWPDTNPIAMRLISAQEMALPLELEQQLSVGEPLVLESESDVMLFFAVPNSNQVLSLSPPGVESETPLRFVFTMLFYGGIISLVLLWVYPLARRLLALGKSARAFGEGQFDKRVSTHQRSFLFGIESEFNSMAQRIQSLVADNKMLASAVSHDLRTPLARLRFGIDLLDEAKDEKVRAEYQGRLSNDLTVMENLVEVLLEYARLDQQLSDMPKSSVNLVDVISVSVDSLLGTKGVTITWQPPLTACIVDAHPRYITMLVNNLLQNAVNYGNKHVLVTINSKRSKILLSVEDDGPGIPEDQRHEMMKPFVRGQLSDGSQSSKGYGMGLAIVSRIAQWHMAEFSIDRSKTLGGARFDILFPVAASMSNVTRLADTEPTQAATIRNR